MAINAVLNPTPDIIRHMLDTSRHRALRRIVTAQGEAWYWRAEDGTHREGADQLGLDYDRPPGAGDIIVD